VGLVVGFSLHFGSKSWKKFDLLFLRNFLTQKAAGFCRAQNNSLALGSLKYFAWKRYSQPLLFAKISKVIANRTFPEPYWSGTIYGADFLTRRGDPCGRPIGSENR
jgi:hypothetical protein